MGLAVVVGFRPLLGVTFTPNPMDSLPPPQLFAPVLWTKGWRSEDRTTQHDRATAIVGFAVTPASGPGG